MLDSAIPDGPGAGHARLVDALRRAGCTNRGRNWTCPAHGDRNPSLSVSEGDGRALYCCKANCTQAAVVDSLDLEMRDLFDYRIGGNGHDPTINTYVYQDENGTPIYEVRRTASKQFFQARIDPDGKRVCEAGCMKSVRRVPFRLPELLLGIGHDDDIYVVEGEKDVERLEREHQVATCNPGGAEKWCDELSKHFVSAKTVTIIQDDDDTGRRHAVQVRNSLRKVGVEAKILKPCAGNDVSEMLDLKHDLAELVEVVAELATAPVSNESVSQVGPIMVSLADVEGESVTWTWSPYLPKRKLAILEGDPGLGKTWVALAIAADISAGRALPRAPMRDPAPVLYMTAEDGLADTLRPRLDAMGADVSLIHVLDGKLNADGKREEVSLSDIDVLDEALSQVKPALLIIDPVQGFLGAGVDMYRANEVRPIMAALARLAEKHDCAILLIRHLRKSASDRAVHRGLGSIDFSAAARSIMLVGQDPLDEQRRVLAHSKSNLSQQGKSLAFEISDGCFHWRGESELKADDLLRVPREERESHQATDDFLRETLADGPVSSNEVKAQADAAGLSWGTTKRRKKALGIGASKGSSGWEWTPPSVWPEGSAGG